MRLRRSVLSKPGIARKRRGKGFAYYGPDGELATAIVVVGAIRIVNYREQGPSVVVG
jgi:DNA topoisomerase-1